jgi:hypothetical protein
MAKNKKINVLGIDVEVYEDNKEDFMSLTDIARQRDSERSDYILQNWMRNRSTIEFIGLWEKFNNPNFNSIEFDGIKNMAGSNSFSLTPKRWIETTNAMLIQQNVVQNERLLKLNEIAIQQMKSLIKSNVLNKLK